MCLEQGDDGLCMQAGKLGIGLRTEGQGKGALKAKLWRQNHWPLFEGTVIKNLMVAESTLLYMSLLQMFGL